MTTTHRSAAASRGENAHFPGLSWEAMYGAVVGYLLVLVGELQTSPSRLMAPRRRTPDERGLSQSTENAILLAGAVTVAGIVVAVITVYVRNHLPK